MNVPDFRIQQEFRAVLHCVFAGGDAQLPGVHRSCGGGVKGRGHAFFQHGLHGLRFRAGQEPQTRHAADGTVAELALHLWDGSGIIGHQQRAAPGEGDLQLGAEPLHAGVAPDGQLRFQTAGLIVVARVDDGGVGPGDARADIRLFFNQ